MGHIHLGVLPRTKRWKHVVDLLDSDASEVAVVTASAVAAERDFARAASDPVFVETVRLLAMIPQAARSETFGRQLRDLGLDVRDDPELSHILGGAGRWLDRFSAQSGRRNDFSELCRRSFIATLAGQIGDGLPGLVRPDASDVRKATERFSRPRDFSQLARAFFRNLTAETLASYLDRTLSAHVGPDKFFAHAGERAAFDDVLEQYCWEATRIIREFAAGWYGKTMQRDGMISINQAAAFGAVAFKKIGEELRYKRDADA